MYSLNRIHLIGYQTQPLSIRQTPGGTSVTDLNLIVPVRLTAENGQEIESKSFHTVTLWGVLADVAGQFVRPGSQVFIAGRLQTDSWEDATSGEKRSRTKVIAQEFILLDPKGGQMPPPQGATALTLSCVNRTELLGNLTRDPEPRTTTSGQTVLTLGIATNESWKDKATGERKERTEFHNVVVWGKKAEELAKTAHKGMKLYVSGRAQTRAFETQSGSKRTVTEVVAETVMLLGMKSAAADSAVSFDVPAKSVAGANEPPPSSPSSSSSAGIPELSYTSEVKVEDLPF